MAIRMDRRYVCNRGAYSPPFGGLDGWEALAKRIEGRGCPGTTRGQDAGECYICVHREPKKSLDRRPAGCAKG